MSKFGTTNTGFTKFFTRLFFFSGAAFSIILIINACAKEPDTLGRDLLPSSDNIHVKVDSTTRITSYTISGRKVMTSANDFYALGSMKDSVFGYSSASLLTQIHPRVLLSSDSIATIDSLVLYLATNDSLDGYYYGNRSSQLTLRVFELNQKMNADSSYFSDINPSEYYDAAAEIAHKTFTPADSLIRIRIYNSEFMNKFLTAPDSTFKSLSKFAEQFYGLYFNVDQVSEGGGYSYINMSGYDTRLTLYFNGNDTASYGYEMAFTSAYAARVNAFTHDYTGFPVAQYLDKPGDSLMYIEGLAGSGGRISFPDLQLWQNKGDSITINKAELILPVENIFYPALTSDDYPPKLSLYTVGADSSYQFPYDYLIDNSGTYFNGNYDVTRKAYIFNIGFHLQSYISGKIENSDMVLSSRKTNSAANRVILKGGSAVNSPVKLKVIYTELF